jgi:hypothetical protein
MSELPEDVLFLKEQNKRLTVEFSRYAHDAEVFRRERDVAEDRASKLAKALAISLHVMRSYKAMGYGDEVHMSALCDAIRLGEDAYIQEITDTKTGEKFLLGRQPSKAGEVYSHPAPGDRSGGRSENNEGDTLEGLVVRDDDTRGCAQS